MTQLSHRNSYVRQAFKFEEVGTVNKALLPNARVLFFGGNVSRLQGGRGNAWFLGFDPSSASDAFLVQSQFMSLSECLQTYVVFILEGTLAELISRFDQATLVTSQLEAGLGGVLSACHARVSRVDLAAASLNQLLLALGKGVEALPLFADLATKSERIRRGWPGWGRLTHRVGISGRRLLVSS